MGGSSGTATMMLHQVEEEAHEGDAKEGDGNGGGHCLGPLLLQFRKGIFSTFNMQAHTVCEAS